MLEGRSTNLEIPPVTERVYALISYHQMPLPNKGVGWLGHLKLKRHKTEMFAN